MFQAVFCKPGKGRLYNAHKGIAGYKADQKGEGMGNSAREKLKKFLNVFSGGDQVLVVINADPDAIASAMAVKRLLWRRAAGVSIARVNQILRPDNMAMVRLLGVDICHVDDIDSDKFHKFVIVDSQPDHHEKFSGFSFHAVIDHHPLTQINARFMDIRPDYGANSSMMTEYLRADGIKPSAKLATGLFYAIKTDTSNFERQTIEADLKAFQFVFRHTNIHLARKIEQADLRLDFLKYFKNGLENMKMRRSKVFVHMEEVSNPDILVLLADFFMRVQSVKWSIVSGVYGNKLIIIFRNDGLRKNAGKMAQKCFSQFGSAGGHKSMARAELPLEGLITQMDITDRKAVCAWLIKRIEKRQKLPRKGFTKERLGISE